MSLKSHTKEQILAAFAAGMQILELDTANSGNDDILIADPDETEADIMADVSIFHEIEIQENWSLRKITVEEFCARY